MALGVQGFVPTCQRCLPVPFSGWRIFTALGPKLYLSMCKAVERLQVSCFQHHAICLHLATKCQLEGKSYQQHLKRGTQFYKMRCNTHSLFPSKTHQPFKFFSLLFHYSHTMLLQAVLSQLHYPSSQLEAPRLHCSGVDIQ